MPILHRIKRYCWGLFVLSVVSGTVCWFAFDHYSDLSFEAAFSEPVASEAFLDTSTDVVDKDVFFLRLTLMWAYASLGLLLLGGILSFATWIAKRFKPNVIS